MPFPLTISDRIRSVCLFVCLFAFSCSLQFCLRVEVVLPEKTKAHALALKLTFNVVNLAGATKQHSAIREGSFAQVIPTNADAIIGTRDATRIQPRERHRWHWRWRS